ncbi:hypothetical protein VNI00_011675 [Paramarasmius palmivorus]|uniref:BTB domain-containing protein n=1 Tax=Paramarasmius palmivorus TaxID=297713 RepID=A0AAW0CE24_9AGAR
MDRDSPVPRRHEQYYIDTIVYQIEGTLFKVPSRYFHEKSEVFQGASQISSTSVEGTSDEHPVKLVLPQDATADDFLQLVRIIYPLTVGLPTPTDLSRTQWISVLKLATPWGFKDIRQRAITNISSSNEDFVERVELGRRYSVKSWVLEGLTGLSSTENALLPLEKLEELGLKTAMRLLYIRNWQQTNKQNGACRRAREEVVTSYNGYGNYDNCNQCGHPRNNHRIRSELAIDPQVENIFSDELSMMDKGSVWPKGEL